MKKPFKLTRQIIPVLLLIIMAFAAPASAKTKSVAPAIKISEKKGANNFHYWMRFDKQGAVKFSKVPRLSAKIIIPASLVAKKNIFAIDVSINLHDGNTSVGTLCQDWITFTVNKKGKVKVEWLTPYVWKVRKSSGLLSVKKSGKNYVLTIKNLPFDARYVVDGEERDGGITKPLSKKKKYTIASQVDLNFYDNSGGVPNKLAKKVSGDMYVDKFTITSGKKKILSVDESYKTPIMGGKDSWKISNVDGSTTDVKSKSLKVKMKKISY